MNKTKHPLYVTWANMRRRCNSPSATAYKDYGGRGVTVCPEWDDFWQFVEDMGDKPSPQHTLDKDMIKPGNLVYCKEYCCWATKQEQEENKRPYPKGRKKFSKPRGKGYNKRGNKYYAEIRCNNQHHHLGTFDCPLMAHLAYLDAWNNYHNNLPIK